MSSAVARSSSASQSRCGSSRATVVASAATQILLRCAPQAADAITQAFGLTDGERAFLTTADTGAGLLAGPRHRVAFTAHAAPTEHDLITTDPAELATTTSATAAPPARPTETPPPPPAAGHDDGADPL